MQAGWPRQIWLARSDELRAGYRAEADIESIGLQFLVVFLFLQIQNEIARLLEFL
jgi:hypothetical protein